MIVSNLKVFIEGETTRKYRTHIMNLSFEALVSGMVELLYFLQLDDVHIFLNQIVPVYQLQAVAALASQILDSS